jgi:hypothetical protein
MDRLLVQQQFTSQLPEGVTFQKAFGLHFGASLNQ